MAVKLGANKRSEEGMKLKTIITIQKDVRKKGKFSS